MTEKHIRYSLLFQVAVLFALGVLTAGLVTFASQRLTSDESVTKQTETIAASISEEVILAVREYPAYRWLLEYWYEHSGDLDIEYDADYSEGTRTEEKCRRLSGLYPGIQLKYLVEEDLAAMPEEDRKLYAEIAYSWLITDVDRIKQSHQVNFLFCVLTDEPYDSQFFLFSAADPGAERGSEYEQVYTLGTISGVSPSQQEAMASAIENNKYLADAGKYVDYYTFMDRIGGHDILIGLTYDISDLQATVRTRTLQGTTLAIISQIFLSMVFLMMIYQLVLHPLGEVQENIRLYKNTKDGKTVRENLAKVHPPNELGELSEDVSSLAEEIDDYLTRISQITAERERVSTELEMATKIQTGMLPNSFPAYPGRHEFEIFASTNPAREVGGDFYNFFLIDDDHLFMTIADVSGKGVPAALFMMASTIILANNAIQGKTPAQILTDTNDSLVYNNREEMFVTVWLGILEISTGKLTAANGGHEYPALKKPDGSFSLLRDPHGLVLGGMGHVRYKDYEILLAPGTKLFVYTDGVPEAADPKKRMFGTDRMLDALNAEPDADPEKAAENVRKAVNRFVRDAEQFDDLTMMCLQYNGPEA